MLKLVNINKKVESATILSDIDLYFPSKGLFLISGNSGSGKSTLINIISGIDIKYEGTVELNNKNMLYQRKEYIKNYISLVYQDNNLIDNLNVYENVKIISNREISLNECREKAKIYGIQILIEKEVSNLSGGEKQRISVFGAILKDSPILICDEPTGSCDKKNKEIIAKLMYEASKDKLVILATHELFLFKLFKYNLIKIEDGKILKGPNISEDSDIKVANIIKKKIPIISLLLKKHLFDNVFSNILVLICVFFSGFFLRTSTNILQENKVIGERIFLKTDFNNAIGVSKILEKDESINFVKINSPTREELSCAFPFKSNIFVAFDYLFNFANLSGNHNSDINYVPYFNEKDKRFYANNPLKSSLTSDQTQLVIKCHDSFYNNDGFIVENTVELNYILSKNIVCNDFDFYNIPTIYYPYFKVKDDLNNKKIYEMDNIDNWYSLFLSYDESDIRSSFKKYIVFDKKEIYKIIQSKIYKDTFIFDSYCYSKIELFSQMLNSFSTYSFTFGLITFAGVLLIVIFLIFSKLQKDKRNISIIITRGYSNLNIITSYIIEHIMILFVGFTLSELFYYSLLKIMKNYNTIYVFNFFEITNIVLFLMLILCLILISCLIFFLFYIKLKKIDIIKELHVL